MGDTILINLDLAENYFKLVTDNRHPEGELFINESDIKFIFRFLLALLKCTKKA